MMKKIKYYFRQDEHWILKNFHFAKDINNDKLILGNTS